MHKKAGRLHDDLPSVVCPALTPSQCSCYLVRECFRAVVVPVRVLDGVPRTADKLYLLLIKLIVRVLYLRCPEQSITYLSVTRQGEYQRNFYDRLQLVGIGVVFIIALEVQKFRLQGISRELSASRCPIYSAAAHSKSNVQIDGAIVEVEYSCFIAACKL